MFSQVKYTHIYVEFFKATLRKTVVLTLKKKQTKEFAMKSKKTPKQRKTALQIKFGQLVREKRIPLALSQLELAGLANLHFTYISSVERGERNITLMNIYSIAVALGCKLRDLMPG